MIEKIKESINDKRNRNVRIKYNGGRNQIECYNGKIQGVYKNIFVIITDDNKLKTFSYADILMGSVKIY